MNNRLSTRDDFAPTTEHLARSGDIFYLHTGGVLLTSVGRGQG